MLEELREARAILERTPAVLEAWLSGLDPVWSEVDEGPGSFSPSDVVAHLIDGEHVDWIPRLQQIQHDGDARPFEPFDRTAFRERFEDMDLAGRLAAFREARTENLAKLDSLALTEADLERRGLHPELGPVTARQLISTWVAHDLTHLAQIARAMGGRYREAVGPWRAYLPLLGE